MSTNVWRGDAVAVAQVRGYTFGGTWQADDLILVTIGNKVVTITAGSTVIATIIDTIVTALAALDATVYPEFAEVTATRSGSDLRLTANTAGIPFAATLTTTESDAGAADAQTIDGADTSTGVAVTANSGPNDWSVPANWSLGVIPVNGDTVYLENTSVDILYGLAQSGVTGITLYAPSSFTGKVGLPQRNASGYVEYRATYLALGATTVTIGDGTGTGTARFKLNTGSGGTVLRINNTNTPLEPGLGAVQWKGTGTNTIHVNRGTLSICTYGGETATVATINSSFIDNPETDATIKIGLGTTLTTLNQFAGTVTIFVGGTTWNLLGGKSFAESAGAWTTINNRGGILYYKSSGTITTLLEEAGVTVDFSQNTQGCTITNLVNMYSGSTFKDPNNKVTLSGGFKPVGCSLADITMDQGNNRTYTPS